MSTDPRTGETLAAFTARHEAEGHVVWTGDGARSLARRVMREARRVA